MPLLNEVRKEGSPKDKLNLARTLLGSYGIPTSSEAAAKSQVNVLSQGPTMLIIGEHEARARLRMGADRIKEEGEEAVAKLAEKVRQETEPYKVAAADRQPEQLEEESAGGERH